ncbi:UNVERIFIED_CONTAM: cytochrome [Sesamum radiatum]|uniref:Cytochrome n=1 Tax=Sesamum radiatum TaxID=300843 RepID=A0AAW2L5P0_SESRA
MLHGIRVDEVKSMVRALNRASEQRRVVDMKAVFFELTMNVMMRMIAGKRYYGENVGEVEEARRFREIVKDSFRLSTSNMGDFLPVIRWLGVGGVEKKEKAFMQELVEGCKRRFKSYGGDGEGGGDVVAEGKTKTMIEMLLALQAKEPEYYTDALIRNLMLVLLTAGTDTSAGTTEWALSLLLNHPHVLKKAQLEIDNHIGHNRLIEESDIVELPYLRCIINETLRLYPAGPLLVPHESSEQCTVGAYRVPAGTILLVNAWAIHNDPKNWEDTREFKPERFEGLEGNRDGFKLMPFGSGRRGCPGEALAVRMVGFGLGSLIQCFDWERNGKELIDMTEGLGLSMPKAEPLMAYCRARPVAAKLLSQI